MILIPAEVERDSPLLLLETGVTAIVFAAAFAWPQMGNKAFRAVERGFARVARRQRLAVLLVFLATALLRLALLPLHPIPSPFAPDDFSNLLAADTFAHGRLANPTPALWQHFESIHIDMQPTYGSMYFPAQGLIMALGQVTFGHPWWGVLLSDALFCAALTWMLQAWMPPGWALLGGVLAVVRLGLFSYWINTYTGAGFLSALGGALVLGAWPRVKQHARLFDGVLLAAGASILVITRPYEGLLLCLPVTAALVVWIVRDPRRPAARVLLRRAALPVALLMATLGWFGLYNQRAFGKATTLPYTLNRATYAMAPYFVWQSARPEPPYRHPAMRLFYYESELKAFNKTHGWQRFVPTGLMKIALALRFFAGVLLLLPLLALLRVGRDRRMRFLWICMGSLTAGMAIEIFLIPHYLAAFTVVFYAIGLQAMRHLCWWQPERKPVGRTMMRLVVALCLALAVLRCFLKPLHMEVGTWPAAKWSGMWYGPENFGTERAEMAAQLARMPGSQLVFVHYDAWHNPLDEWVYNAADLAGSRVIWARQMSPAEDRALLESYSGRTAWLAEPDQAPARLTPYNLR